MVHACVLAGLDAAILSAIRNFQKRSRRFGGVGNKP